MLNANEKEYYSRQMLLPDWGAGVQELLKKSRVLVVGAGALGCAVLQSIVRSGVGRVIIIDNDVVAVSNLQRQLLFDLHDIGESKANTAKRKLEMINPYVSIEAHVLLLSSGNALNFVADCDVVIDASDNFKTKYLVNDVCVEACKPLVFGAIEGYEGQVSVFNYMDGPTYRCIFPSASSNNDCDVIGVMPALPAIIGSLQANEAIKIVTGIGDILSGKILLYSALSNSFNTISITAMAENTKPRTHSVKTAEDAAPEVSAISFSSINSDYELVDVRDEDEHEQFNIGGRNIPLYSIDEMLGEFGGDKKIVTYCSSGVKAKQAAIVISVKKKVKVFYLDSPLASLKNS